MALVDRFICPPHCRTGKTVGGANGGRRGGTTVAILVFGQGQKAAQRRAGPGDAPLLRQQAGGRGRKRRDFDRAKQKAVMHGSRHHAFLGQRFTDHDRTCSFDGASSEPESGFAASEIRAGSDFAVDAQDVTGALTSDRITETDIFDGRWDKATI